MSFKSEFSPQDFKTVKSTIRKWAKSRWITSAKSEGKSLLMGNYSWANIEAKMGLAYTSSSDYAALWVCSDEVYMDEGKKYHIIGFAISQTGGFVSAVCWDTNENEIIIPLN